MPNQEDWYRWRMGAVPIPPGWVFPQRDNYAVEQIVFLLLTFAVSGAVVGWLMGLFEKNDS